MTTTFLSEAAERLRLSVARIVSGERANGMGAAIAWRSGLFVTSAHVVMSPRVHVMTPDGRTVPGEVVARDVHRDVAIVRVPGARMPVVQTADPATLRPGSLVFAVGHPFGVVDAVSAGVFQAVGWLPSGLELSKERLRWVQADVRLGPGNSGGPLADSEGRVIGVSAMIVAGLALAVPSTDVDAMLAGV